MLNLSRRIATAISIILFFAPLIWSAELDLPLPADSRKINEKNVNIGPSSTFVQFYETSLAADKVYSFYRKEMAKSGWQQDKDNVFIKDRNYAVIAVLPGRSKQEKTRFTISNTVIPTKEEVLSARKENPDKLSFMPVYPGSVQIFLWDTPTGVSGSYETKSNIQDVLFFYKSGMLNYGWALYNEASPVTQAVDCPQCKGTVAATSSHASLTFRRGNNESCSIRLSETKFASTSGGVGEKKADSAQDSDIISSLENKTHILVTYNEGKVYKK